MADLIVGVRDLETRRVAFDRLEVPRKGDVILYPQGHPEGLVLTGLIKARGLTSLDSFASEDGSIFLDGTIELATEIYEEIAGQLFCDPPGDPPRETAEPPKDPT